MVSALAACEEACGEREANRQYPAVCRLAIRQGGKFTLIEPPF